VRHSVINWLLEGLNSCIRNLVIDHKA